MRPLTAEEWRDIKRRYWMVKCSQADVQYPPIVYIVPKREKNGRKS